MKKTIFLSFLISISINLSTFSQVDLSDADANFEDGNYEVALKQYLKGYKKFNNTNEYQIN